MILKIEKNGECDQERSLTLSHTSPGFYVSAVEVFLKTLGKGEIARNE